MKDWGAGGWEGPGQELLECMGPGAGPCRSGSLSVPGRGGSCMATWSVVTGSIIANKI